MELSANPGVWIAALLTIGILSFLYADNWLYKLCESLFIGTSAGYLFVVYYLKVVEPKLIYNLFTLGDLWYLVPAGLSAVMMMRLFPKVGWVSRYAVAFVIGINAGLIVINFMKENLLNQIAATIVPLLVWQGENAERSFDAVTSINNAVMVVGVLCALVYFFFSKEHKGITGHAARIGTWFLMISFGAAFGFTIMARISLLVGRISFLFGDWLGMM